MDEYISKQDAVDYCKALMNAELVQNTDDWGYGKERYNQTEVILEFIENRQPADVVSYSIEPDGTLTVTVPKGTKRIGRILIEEDGTQYGGLFYPDTGGCFLSSMERSEQDGNNDAEFQNMVS